MNKKSIAFFVLMGCSLLATAHEFWLQSKKYKYAKREQAVFDFVVGEDFMGEYWNLTKERIVRLEHHVGNDVIELAHQIVEGKSGGNLSLELNTEGTQLLIFQSNNSFIEMEAEKFNEYLEEDGLNNIIKLRKEVGISDKPAKEFYARCAKVLLQVENIAQGNFSKVTGMPLEIIPLNNPYAIEKTEHMQFKVLYDGKPVPDILVKVWNRKGGRTFLQNIYTENNGIISTPLSNEGQWMVSCVKMEPSKHEGADYQSYWASLVFGF